MAISIYFMFYNFVRPHQTLTKESGDAGKRSPTTPAMKAGLTDHIWTFEEMIETVLGNWNLHCSGFTFRCRQL